MPSVRRRARCRPERLRWTDLDPSHLKQLIRRAREEDLAGAGLRVCPRRPGDHSTAVASGREKRSSALLVARQPAVLCGLSVVPLVLAAYGRSASVRFLAKDGQAVKAGDAIARIDGPARQLLSAERVILNFLQRLCGVATQTARYVAALGDSPTRLLDTRKTTPGWRMLEKYAVACGGGWNHRLGLFDRVMLKDNHLALLGFDPERVSSRRTSAEGTPGQALAAAVRRSREADPAMPVEVEVDAMAQIPPVLDAGADIILLDNFTPAQLRKAVALIGDRALTEASGGITLRTLPRLARLGLDFISTGALVHQSTWVDIGLDWSPTRP